MDTNTKNQAPLKVVGLETMSSAMQYATNYYQWLFDLCKDYVGNEIIDIGSGFGSYINFFKTKKIIVVDLSPQVIEKIQKEYSVYNNLIALSGDICDVKFAKELSCSFIDTVICFNVLEHIQDDITALRNIHRILERKHGNLIIVVPAHQFLYGQMDRLAGHYRRYSKRELAMKLKNSNFQIIKFFYFNSFGFIGWFLNNKILKHENLSAREINFQIRIYNKIIPAIKKVDRFLNLPFGQSLFTVAKAV